MNSVAGFLGLSQIVIGVGLAALLSSCRLGYDPFAIVELQSYHPTVVYEFGGRYVSAPVASVCAIRTAVRDVRGTYLLLDSIDGLNMVVRPGGVNGELTWFPRADQLAKEVRLSPDLGRVAWVGRDRNVPGDCSVGLVLGEPGKDRGTLAWCSPDGQTSPTSLSWSYDGKLLAFGYQGHIYVWQDGKAVVIAEGDAPRFAPKDDRLAYQSGDDLVIVPNVGEIANGRRKTIRGLIGKALEWSPTANVLTLARRSDWQPGDSRFAVEFGALDLGTWEYSDWGLQRWGENQDLRWVGPVENPVKYVNELRQAGCAGRN